MTVTERCEECGFDYDALALPEAPAALRRFGRRYQAPLTRFLPGEDTGTVVRAHPLDGVWSALEYACHVRDVLDVQRERIEVALVEECPTATPMGREERVIQDHYNDQDPGVVTDELAANAGTLAALVETLTPAQFERTMRYTYPEWAVRPVSWVVRHTVHECEHHLLDIGRVLRSARGR
ncbi:MAG: DinB family protein [Acidimicrobiales bacterium]